MKEIASRTCTQSAALHNIIIIFRGEMKNGAESMLCTDAMNLATILRMDRMNDSVWWRISIQLSTVPYMCCD